MKTMIERELRQTEKWIRPWLNVGRDMGRCDHCGCDHHLLISTVPHPPTHFYFVHKYWKT